MSFNASIGLGSALTQLPTGILQGEEIQRRRSREDEMADMARAEFQNRQEMFGRTKKGWTMEDAVNAAISRYEASGKAPEDEQALYSAMDAAGAGRDALNTRGVIQSQTQSAGTYKMQEETHKQGLKAGELNIDKLQQEKRDRDVLHAWAAFGMGNQEPLKQMANEAIAQDPRFKGGRLIDIGYGDGKAHPRKDADGIDMMVYRVQMPDGSVVSKALNIETAGAVLGSTALSNVGTQQAHRQFLKSQLNLQASAMSDSKADRLLAQLQAQKNADMKPHLDEINKNEEIIKAIIGKKYERGMDKAAVEKDIADAQAKIDTAKQNVSLIASGFKATGDGHGVKTIAPMGSRDRADAINMRDDGSLWVNTNGASRSIAKALVPMPVAGESPSEFEARREAAAKSVPTNQWIHILSDGKSIRPVTDAEYQKHDDAWKQTWRPVQLNGMDYGELWGHHDVIAANEMADIIKVKRRGGSIKLSGGGVVRSRK